MNESNDRITVVLRAVSGEDHGTDVAGWTGWLVNLNGYALADQTQTNVPTYTVAVPLAYQPQMVPITNNSYVSGPITTEKQFNIGITARGLSRDCFGAGTLVRTMTGPRPIETLRTEDMVLTQSTSTGALGYQPVLTAHHNPPSPTFRIKLEADTIVSSPFHRFWKVGQGWVMARDLNPGDRLRLLNGTDVVATTAKGNVELVYNLDIAEDADFFAGAAAVLVHDQTLLDPRLVPFDRAPEPGAEPVAAR